MYIYDEPNIIGYMINVYKINESKGKNNCSYNDKIIWIISY
jgi:hypothetical protein